MGRDLILVLMPFFGVKYSDKIIAGTKQERKKN